jgi:SagB-type dehydrogenase family enzyme
MSVNQIAALEFGEYSFGGEQTDIARSTVGNVLTKRPPSANGFDGHASPLPKELFDKFLEDSFLSNHPDGAQKRRSYPSGGALYSVQVTLFVRNISNIEPGAYHLLPCSARLEALENLTESEVCERLFLGGNSAFAGFDFVILYSTMAIVPIAKYRRRGYRLALVEAGSMYQLASLSADTAGLGNRVWGGFDDDGLSLSLGLDPRVCWPVMCQLFGRSL